MSPPVAAAGLGAPTAHFAAAPAGCLLRVAWWMLIGMGLFFVGVGYMVVDDPKTPAQDRWMGWACAAVMGAPPLAGGLWMRRRLLMLSTMQVWLMPGGLAWRSHGGEVAAPWDEIEKLYTQLVRVIRDGSEAGEFVRYTVVTRSGRRAIFSEFLPGILELGQALEAGIAPRRLAAARARLEAGEPVAFDRLTLTRAGLEHGGRKLAWADLQSFAVKAGVLTIAGAGGAFATLDVADVPNFKVLRALVDERAGR